MKTAIYPGTFDPVTFGHLDVLKRASQLFDKIIVAFAINTRKEPLFSLEKRCELFQANLNTTSNIEIQAFNGLTVDFAKKQEASAIIRGLRAISDFEYEFQLAQMNRHLDAGIETIFLMPSQDYFYTSSQLIKSISQFSPERIAHFVPENVLQALTHHFKKQ